MSSLSLIVLTSPGREANLHYCLASIRQQTCLPDEIILVDDGSAGGQALIDTFDFPCLVQYLWRENDYCMSRSYNLGVQQAQGEFLVFMSSDILLNPDALGFYQVYFKNMPDVSIWGYFGSEKSETCPSHFFPERQVNLKDSRFRFNDQWEVRCSTDMMKYPQVYAWGGNWGISKAGFIANNGFNERFRGWGYEDVEFANRWIGLGKQMVFSMDVWGEHQIHDFAFSQESYEFNRQQIGFLNPSVYEPGLLYNIAQNKLPGLLGMPEPPVPEIKLLG